PGGYYPTAPLLRDADDNLYGTTQLGGISSPGCPNGCGVVFKIAANGAFHVLYAFRGYSDGSTPYAGLIADATGNLYGTAGTGGPADCDGFGDGCGTIFKISKRGKFTLLYTFHNGSDGAYPEAGLKMDQLGNLYGTTNEGGSGLGVVFKLTPEGTETVLHTFTGAPDGASPLGGLLQVGSYLYGATLMGGTYNAGVIFRVSLRGEKDTILHHFGGGSDGAHPVGDLIARNGFLYGAAAGGGTSGDGVIFKLSFSGAESILYDFQGADGNGPNGGLITANGAFYGTFSYGGAEGEGGVF